MVITTLRLKVYSQGQIRPQIAGCGLGAWPHIPQPDGFRTNPLSESGTADSATAWLQGNPNDLALALGVAVLYFSLALSEESDTRNVGNLNEGRPFAMEGATAGGREGAAVPPGSVVAWGFLDDRGGRVRLVYRTSLEPVHH